MLVEDLRSRDHSLKIYSSSSSNSLIGAQDGVRAGARKTCIIEGTHPSSSGVQFDSFMRVSAEDTKVGEVSQEGLPAVASWYCWYSVEFRSPSVSAKKMGG